MSVLHALCRLYERVLQEQVLSVCCRCVLYERALYVHVPCCTVCVAVSVCCVGGGLTRRVHNTCTCFNTPKVIASLNLSLPRIRVAAVPGLHTLRRLGEESAANRSAAPDFVKVCCRPGSFYNTQLFL